MPATPAWPPRSLPRLFVRTPLAGGSAVELDAGPANYLGNVMRLGPGAELLVFDGATGEWLARIADVGRKRMTLRVEQQTREQESVPDVTLAFAPVKRAQTDWLVEKATELGVRHLQPVMTQRTVAERIKRERLESIAVEAAEQCGRTLLPSLAEPVGLKAFLQANERPLYFADENGGEPAAIAMKEGPATILVGPEGGFTDDERTMVRASAGAVPISLGPRILRAETAALAALTAYMALAGDWR
ncbi:16S rRNA (uracil(1498)-N(3))-methyltransferase [Sphingomonas ginkgonis]|uniref:Ribosomal RNA small subunit methyltransferase E n=1 Tax=Sphingomonas ginkgonis TaxID=2315330 RepID=A0A3S0ELB1_9SPHN|nr:16S rRNA (uracil(1498)-N(3))-methyltransferase [Sphingomonas ginkgonis]RST30226.1 16S rRNA (uracil(1498)-N(3))-methyltransferase [Sphingomonas ginkgonis]